MYVRLKCILNCYKYKRKIRLFSSSSNANNCEAENTFSQPPKILFFGTDQFSLPSLEILYKNSKELQVPLGVVTSFKQPANCVRLYAERKEVPLYKWPVSFEICQKYDLGVVVSFGHLIPENIIHAFSLGMINVHASLLPRWRGAAPIIYAILSGDNTTGVSIMRIQPKQFDVGEILAQKKVSINKDVKMPELHAELAKEGSQLLLKVVNNFDEYNKKAQQQNESEATFAPKVKHELTEVLWTQTNASELCKRFRALYGFKALCTFFQGKQVQLLEIKNASNSFKDKAELVNLKPGNFVFLRDTKCLLVCCGDNSYIEVLRLRVEGKKAMTALDFHNGYLKKLKLKLLSFSNKEA